MSRVLVLGYALPRHDPGVRKEAHNYRTWQLADSLVGDGHDVRLAAIDLFRPPWGSGREHVGDELLDAWVVDHRRRSWRREIQALHDEFQPNAVVATGQLMCLVACDLRTSVALWFDLYGDPLFEWQAAMGVAGSHRGLRSASGFQKLVLQRGDAFSTVSTRQTEAFRGRLALLGRVNHLTCGYEFVHTILPAIPPYAEQEAVGSIYRGTAVPSDAFVVLWVGGYNAWSDPATLFSGIDSAMSEASTIHFVSIGGPVVSDIPYGRLQELIATSRHRERYHLMGWRQERGEVLKAYREADIGISVDLPIYETHFGTRTRLLEMLRYDLPVITSDGCELAATLKREGAALTFESQDSRSLTELLVRASRDRSLLQAGIARGRGLAEGLLAFETTTAPLRAWVQAPRVAPDRAWSRAWTLDNTVRWWWRYAAWRLSGKF